ncbi:uncharacterized protein LOC124369174 isoform X2 [Homalodisca vitripennis]|uniref:uncharacterized protein LOC124369174 isoform X2 n=1 Tax=Homalodisca vitripennis TaxID=197043 RepID=UPI001EE9B1FE|nr:uncharacterized protein LOC124369174 isoform X2 [Homalodisca vitripennis]
MEGYPVMQVVEYRMPRPPQRLPLHSGVKKYVFLCSVCGGLASLLGTLFLAVYLILRTYTSSLDYFETIPTYIPAAMLMVTGLAVMCLARRRNRYIFLIKLCGLCCLMCVGTCVLVTVTTTVVHMSRLQSLRECVYTLKTQTCTCYSVLLESASERSDEGSRYVFNATPDCEAIHGPLYLCLRALFGLSVIGILVCIFCCMLVYQLLSHERKKMYWEQLELRCRYLYGQASNLGRNPGLAGAQPVSTQHCACCQQFRYQQDVLTWEPSDNRFWSGGQVGNLYSPNPVGEDCVTEPATSGWSWRRLPWNRQPSATLPPPSVNSHRSCNSYQQPLNCSSPDSQYGFSSEQGRVATVSSGASYTVIEPTSGCQVYHWGPPPPYSNPNSPSRPVLCPPGPHHHHCQRNYVNTSGGDVDDNESARVPPLRRRSDLPLPPSDQHAKPQRADCGVSPRIKYLHNKLQNASVNTTRKRTQEPSESEVYFADVSSCNVSVRNDSMSLYGEALEAKQGERMPTVCDESQEMQNEESSKKQSHSSPTMDKKGLCFQIMRNQEGQRQNNVLSPKEINNFQKVPSGGEFSYTGMSLEVSEDDPELVNFSRQASLKRRLPHYKSDFTNKIKNEPEQDLEETIHKGQNEFPSPMSLSSPSTVSKGTGGFYTEIVNSDNGSSDSVWSGYSPGLLAPDAQYEVIPEHRLAASEDLNGNPNDVSGNRDRLKLYLFSKKRHYPQVIEENWSVNSSLCCDNQDFADRLKCGGHNINSQKNSDGAKDSVQKNLRSNEHCLADILNSPKSNYKNRREQMCSNHSIPSYNERRRSEFSPLCDHVHPEPNVGGYYSINENHNVCCDRTNHDSYDLVYKEKTEILNSQKMTESHEALTSAPKVMDRGKFTNSNFVNSLESSEKNECFHSDSSCRCFTSKDLTDSDLNQVRPVDV